MFDRCARPLILVARPRLPAYAVLAAAGNAFLRCWAKTRSRRLIEIGIKEERIRVKPDRSPVVIDETTAPLERPKLAAGKVLLLYSGNWGVAHDYSTFLKLIGHHSSARQRTRRAMAERGRRRSGPDRSPLREEHLPYIRSHLVPLEKLANLLVTPDAHLITLSDAFVGFVLPSKVHGCVASNKPILFVGSDRSDVHRLCLRSTAPYQRVSVGDVAGCVTALEHLADHVDQTLGVKGNFCGFIA